MQVSTIDNEKTMTSREIAEYTTKEHKNVIRDIRAMLSELKKDGSNVRHPREDKDARGYTACFYLNRELTDTLLTGYSATARLAVIKRWHELESQQNKAPAFEIPTTLSGALRLAAEQAETIEKQDAILLEQAPKMAVYELLADRKQDVSTTIVAKQLGTTATKLNDFLREHGVKMMGADLPKAGHIQWFNVVSIIANGHECLQCLITPYGQIEITKLWHTHKIKNILQKVPKLL